MRAALALLGLAAAIAPAVAGAATPRVIEGAPIVTPRYMGLLATGTGTCGGAAVAPHVFLTAAHCLKDKSDGWVTPRNIAIVFGQQDPWSALKDGLVEPTWVVRRAVARYRVLSNGVTLGDVALLQLQTRAPATIRAAPRLGPDLGRPGRQAVVMGWGKTRGHVETSTSPVLLETRMAVQDPDVCASRYAEYDRVRLLCAYNGSSSTCQGDSGGPLLSSHRGRRYVIGIVSTGDKYCSVKVPEIYTRLSRGPMASWLARQTDRLERLANGQGTAAPDDGADPLVSTLF